MHLEIKQINKLVGICAALCIIAFAASVPLVSRAAPNAPATGVSPIDALINAPAKSTGVPLPGSQFTPPGGNTDTLPQPQANPNSIPGANAPTSGSSSGGTSAAAGTAGTGTAGQAEGSVCTDQATCFANMLSVIPAVSGFIAYVAAYFFDIMAQLSLTSSAYALAFLSTGWQLVLAIANMAFLFILIYIALTIMFEADTAGTMRMLATLIIMALLVNFSFFITRVVIDGGNLLAVQFYNAINPPPFTPSLLSANEGISGLSGPGQNVRDLTSPLMQMVDIQNNYGTTAFTKWSAALRAQGGTGALTEIITLTFLFLAVAVLYWILTFVFFTAGIKFTLRTVGLWFIIIVAPLAFAIKPLERIGPVKKMYESWQQNLVEFAFYPAVFFFVFYLIVTIVNGMTACTTQGNITSCGAINAIFEQLVHSQNYSLADTIAESAVRLGIIIVLLYYGMKGADMIASQANQLTSVISNKVSGFVANRAAGTVGWAGRNTLGAAGKSLYDNKQLRAEALTNPFARALWRGSNRLQNATYDARNLGAVQAVAKKANVGISQGTKHSYAADYNDRVAWRVKEAQELAPTPESVKATREKVIRNLPQGQFDELNRLKKEFDDAQKEFDDKKAVSTVKERKDLKDKLDTAKKAFDDSDIVKNVKEQTDLQSGRKVRDRRTGKLISAQNAYANSISPQALRVFGKNVPLSKDVKEEFRARNSWADEEAAQKIRQPEEKKKNAPGENDHIRTLLEHINETDKETAPQRTGRVTLINNPTVSQQPTPSQSTANTEAIEALTEREKKMQQLIATRIKQEENRDKNLPRVFEPFIKELRDHFPTEKGFQNFTQKLTNDLDTQMKHYSETMTETEKTRLGNQTAIVSEIKKRAQDSVLEQQPDDIKEVLEAAERKERARQTNTPQASAPSKGEFFRVFHEALEREGFLKNNGSSEGNSQV